MASPPRKGSGERPNPAHLQAAELIAAGHPQRVVARQVGMSDRTLRDWLKKPDFVAMVADYKRGFVGMALSRLQQRAHGLIDKLLKLTDSEDERIALAACRDALDRAGVSAEHQQRQAELDLKRAAIQSGEDLLSRLVVGGWVCAPPEGDV